MIDDHLRNIRRDEAAQAAQHFPEKATVLEIGAGAGWQSEFFAERGFTVTAIDLASSDYLPLAQYPVATYDGKTIPFPDASFEVVYSSSVLEHIPHVVEFQKEMRRVCKPGGVIVHVLPAPNWWFWRNLLYYPALLKRAAARLGAAPVPPQVGASDTPKPSLPRKRGVLAKLRARAAPSRHGEAGNFLTEGFHFSGFRWRRLFRGAGFTVESCVPNHLFYTGHNILGSRLSIGMRRKLSRILGSSCRIWRLRNSFLR